MTKITWEENEVVQAVFEIPDAIAASLEKARIADSVQVNVPMTVKQFDPTTQQLIDVDVQVPSLQPRHATLRDMMVAVLVEKAVLPALKAFPPEPLKEIRAAVDAAKAQEAAAIAAALAAFTAGGTVDPSRSSQ